MEIRTTLPPSYSFLFSLIGVSHVKGDIFSWTLSTWLYQIFTIINILNTYWVLVSMSLYVYFNSLPFLKLGQNLGVILIFLDGCFKIICMVIWREDFLGFMDTLSTYSWSGIRTHKLGRSDVTAYGSIRRTDGIAQGSLIFVTIITSLTIIFSFTHSTNNTIYDCWYPFDASSGILFCIALFSQMLAAYTLAYTLVGYCYYYVKLVLLICSQFEGLRDSLRELKQRAIIDLIHSKEDMVKNIVLNEKTSTTLEEPLLPQIIEARMQEQLSRNVAHHNELYRLMQKVKIFYSTPFLVQYVTIAVDLGLSLYITVIIPTYDFDFLVNCVVWVYQIPQAVCYSWFGTKLIEKVHAVRQAAYDCEWYSTTKTFKKCILVIMSRCDQKFMLTAGKIATVTVQTFITVMQSVVSYMTIVANFATKAENTPESFNSTKGYI